MIDRNKDVKLFQRKYFIAIEKLLNIVHLGEICSVIKATATEVPAGCSGSLPNLTNIFLGHPHHMNHTFFPVYLEILIFSSQLLDH